MTRDSTTAVRHSNGAHNGRNGNVQTRGSTPPRVAKYRRTGDQTIQPLVFNEKAYDDAKRYYQEHSELNFHNDLFDYLQNGFVISRPNLFVMFKVIVHEGRTGWFIRFGIGNFLEMLSLMPCPLEFIAFCRDNDKDMRIIDTRAFIKTALSTRVKEEFINGWERK